MRKLFTCWSLFTLLLAGVGVETLSAQDKSEWKTWSEKDANKIIKKAYTAAMPGFFLDDENRDQRRTRWSWITPNN